VGSIPIARSKIDFTPGLQSLILDT
jgi:hypothetical protein